MSKEVTEDVPVRFTEGALKKLHEIQASSNKELAPYLRIGVKGGGCSGLSYLLAFDGKTEKDEQFRIDDIDVIMDKSHVMYVYGMEIHFEEGLNSRGFEFRNPNAKETCGCGESFST